MSPERFFVIQLMFFVVWLAMLLWIPALRPGVVVVVPPAPDGMLVGAIASATDSQPIAGATIEVRKGRNAPTTAPVLAKFVTPAGGRYSLKAPAGVNTMRITASGYEPELRTVTVNPTATTRTDIFLVPSVAPGTARIRLTWGAQPQDLDLHISGPDGAGHNFHIYYQRKRWVSATGQVVSLDRDDRDGFGPETVTLPLLAGKLRVFVHDYTNRGFRTGPQLTMMPRSGAIVDVYTSTGRVAHQEILPEVQATLWTVLEIEGLTGAVRPINTYSIEVDPLAVPSH